MPGTTSSQLGEIGETWSVYRLATLGYESYRTSTGFAAVDVRVVTPARFDVQVKTATSTSWKITSGEAPPSARDDLFYVLVHVDKARVVEHAFVVPSSTLVMNLVATHEAWRLASPRATAYGMTLKHPHRHPQLDLPTDWLLAFEERWDLLPTS